MAGDWIPLMVDTPDKPEIVTLSRNARNGDMRDRRAQVLGYAVALWAYASKHTTDGNLDLRLADLPDLLGGPAELWQGMIDVGWLEETERGLYLPNAEWLTTAGKARELARKRQKRFREKHESQGDTRNAAVTVTSVTREEKRRVKKKKEEEDASPVLHVFPTDGAPDHWELRQSRVDRWRELFPALDVDEQLRSALAWCEGNPTRRKTASGMPRFLANWLASAQNRGHARAGPAGAAPTRKPTLEELIPDDFLTRARS